MRTKCIGLLVIFLMVLQLGYDSVLLAKFDYGAIIDMQGIDIKKNNSIVSVQS